MRNVFLFFGLCLIISSCKKDNSSPNNQTSNPPSSYLSSVWDYSGQQLVVDSLIYDTTHRIAELLEYVDYDTTGGVSYDDSLKVVFSFKINTTVPYSYTFTDIPQGNINDVHDLSYDNQNRITKDTSLSGSNFVTYYTYPDNNIASTVLFNGSTSISDNQIDTLFLSNGNIVSENAYAPNDATTADSLELTAQLGYSSYANPAYYPSVANTFAPMLYILSVDGFGGGYQDFISKNLTDKISGVGEGFPPISINVNWVTDTKGRVIEGTIPFIGYERFFYY